MQITGDDIQLNLISRVKRLREETKHTKWHPHLLALCNALSGPMSK